jgi:hypothetical protein
MHKEVGSFLENLFRYTLETIVRCHMLVASNVGRKIWFHRVEISILTKKSAFDQLILLPKSAFEQNAVSFPA